MIRIVGPIKHMLNVSYITNNGSLLTQHIILSEYLSTKFGAYGLPYKMMKTKQCHLKQNKIFNDKPPIQLLHRNFFLDEDQRNTTILILVMSLRVCINHVARDVAKSYGSPVIINKRRRL